MVQVGEVLFRPFMRPLRLLWWWVIASIPVVNLLVLGLGLECVRDAERGIPETKVRNLLKDTGVALLLSVLYFLPALFAYSLTWFFSNTSSTRSIVLILFAILTAIGAYFLPAAFVLAVRGREWTTSFKFSWVKKIAMTGSYVKIWLITLVINLVTSVIVYALGTTEYTVLPYFAGTLIQLINIVIVFTMYSYIDSRGITH